jgi:hypothetical protein
MPDWVDNYTEVTGPEDQIEQFEGACFMKEGPRTVSFDFGRVVPMPIELRQPTTFAELSNKEHWAKENWGTKWNADGTRILARASGRLAFEFETPWSAPWPVFAALSNDYPELVFELNDIEAGTTHRYADGSREEAQP